MKDAMATPADAPVMVLPKASALAAAFAVSLVLWWALIALWLDVFGG